MPSLSSLSFRNVLLLSVAIRAGFILYSEWHDARSVVKYTDVDYRVFSDAAAFLLQPGPGDANRAQGPWAKYLSRWVEFGDPYTRETYRYTPLLALLLTPNGWLHPSFGKYVFALCDIVNGILIYQLLKTEILPRTRRVSPPPPASTTKTLPQANDASKSSVQPLSASSSSSYTTPQLATLYSAVHLLNPLVFSISTRGSSESVLSLFVLGSLYAGLKDRWDVCAVLLGLSTHWKIYPVIYGVACLGVVGGSGSGGESGSGGSSGGGEPGASELPVFVKRVVNWKTIRFTFVSAGTFLLLGAGCYAVWGYPFLYESYLYHLHRLDHRHNFSPYFYLTYLTYPSLSGASSPSLPSPFGTWTSVMRSPLTSFVPQMGLALGLGFLFGRREEDLVFTWFVQTVVFVVFNKVCTSQYFLWYLLLLPLLLPQLRAMSRTKAGACVAVWVGTQALWLAHAYQLEFLGRNVYFGLWVRGLVYVVGNCWVLAEVMEAYGEGKVA